VEGLLEGCYYNTTGAHSFGEYRKAHQTHSDRPFRVFLYQYKRRSWSQKYQTHGDRPFAMQPAVIAFKNTVKLTKPTVIGLLEGYHFNTTGSYSF
jgi:hypothetical protein